MNKAKTISMTLTALKVIGLAGALGVLLVCPAMAQVFEMFEEGKYKKKFYRSHANSVVSRLCENGSIKLIYNNGVTCYALTEKGHATLAKYELKQATINKPKKWDNKWRLVIFDVRETRRWCRDGVRESLRNLGFKYLQDSVWIYPYPCEKIIELSRTAYSVRHDAKYLICQRFNGDEKFLSFFNLIDN